MMQEDIVPFEIAKKLKEKGFREECLMYYTSTGSLYSCSIDTYYRPNQELDYSDLQKSFNSGNNVGFVDTPSISQVLKWLRKEHHLHFEVVGAACGYNLIISDTPNEGGTDRYYSHANDDGPNDGGAWDEYEDCVMYGVEYVLDNLI